MITKKIEEENVKPLKNHVFRVREGSTTKKDICMNSSFCFSISFTFLGSPLSVSFLISQIIELISPLKQAINS